MRHWKLYSMAVRIVGPKVCVDLSCHDYSDDLWDTTIEFDSAETLVVKIARRLGKEPIYEGVCGRDRPLLWSANPASGPIIMEGPLWVTVGKRSKRIEAPEE